MKAFPRLPYFTGDKARPFPILMSPKQPKTLSEVAPYLSCFFSEWQTKQNLRDYGETSVRIVLDRYSIRNDLEQIYCKKS